MRDTYSEIYGYTLSWKRALHPFTFTSVGVGDSNWGDWKQEREGKKQMSDHMLSWCHANLASHECCWCYDYNVVIMAGIDEC